MLEIYNDIFDKGYEILKQYGALTKESKKYVLDIAKNADKDNTGETYYSLGFIYLENKLIEKDFNEALHYFMLSSDLGFHYANIALVIIFYYRFNVEENDEMLDEYMLRTLDGDDSICHFDNMSKLFDLFLEASKLDCLSAINLIAQYYCNRALDANDIPERWARCDDDYCYNTATIWLAYASDEGDTSANYRAYKLLENYDLTAEEVLLDYLKKAAVYDEYPDAIKEYNEKVENGEYDGFPDDEDF